MAISLKRPSAKLTKTGYLSALQWGVFATVGLCITTVLTNAMHYKTYEPHLFWHDIVLFFIMICGVLNYRKKQNGFLSMRQAYLFCVVVGFVAALLFGLCIWIQAEYINLDLVKNYITEQHAMLAKAKISDIERHKQLNIISQAHASWLASKVAIDFLLLSVFVPLLLSIFFRKEKKQ